MYIAIDLGGTSCRVASAISLNDLQFNKKEFSLTHSFKEDFNKIVNLIHELANGKVDGIGLGAPGKFNEDKTLFSNHRNLTEWSEKPLPELFVNEFHCPFFMDNDAVTAALGKAYFGEGKNQSFAFIAWGTGIGGAKAEYKGGKIFAEKLDWSTYFKDWEEKCGGKEIEKKYSKAAINLTEDEWREVMSNFEQKLKIFISKTNAHLVIFGGGISKKQESRLQQLANDYNIKKSHLGENTGIYGSFALIKKNMA